MGEAKKRGTYEERKAQAVERNMIAAKERVEHRSKNNIISVGSSNRSSMLVAVAAAMAVPRNHGKSLIVNGHKIRS